MSLSDITHCPRCGRPLSSGSSCVCGYSSIFQYPSPAVAGWVCPLCGRANSPYSITCPCVPFPAPMVTYASDSGLSEASRYQANTAQYATAGGVPTNGTVTATN